MTGTSQVPGWEGSVGPFPGQYTQPHVYARDVHSGAGNCVCGSGLADRLHVPVPFAPLGTAKIGTGRRENESVSLSPTDADILARSISAVIQVNFPECPEDRKGRAVQAVLRIVRGDEP